MNTLHTIIHFTFTTPMRWYYKGCILKIKKLKHEALKYFPKFPGEHDSPTRWIQKLNSGGCQSLHSRKTHYSSQWSIYKQLSLCHGRLCCMFKGIIFKSEEWNSPPSFKSHFKLSFPKSLCGIHKSHRFLFILWNTLLFIRDFTFKLLVFYYIYIPSLPN